MNKQTRKAKTKNLNSTDANFHKAIEAVLQDEAEYSDAVKSFAVTLLQSKKLEDLSNSSLVLALRGAEMLLTSRNMMHSSLEPFDKNMLSSAQSMNASALACLRSAGLSMNSNSTRDEKVSVSATSTATATATKPRKEYKL